MFAPANRLSDEVRDVYMTSWISSTILFFEEISLNKDGGLGRRNTFYTRREGWERECWEKNSDPIPPKKNDASQSEIRIRREELIITKAE